MPETDWEALYQSGDTQWDKGEASPGLVDFLAANPSIPGGCVLIPGCGLGHDVRAWAKAGFETIGLDLAPSAVQRAQAKTAEEAPPSPLPVEFRLGSFLDLEPFTRFDWVFEHTLYCAIDPARRDEYVQAVRRWLKPGGQFLAVHYMLRDTEGPPFGCGQAELMERFSPHFELKQGWVPRSYPNRTGLELMLWWQDRRT